VGGRLLVLRNILKAWLLLIGACSALGLLGWALGGYRLLSIFVFCGALLAGALYWYADRVAVGLVRGLVSIDGTDDGRDGWVVIGAAAVGALAFALWMRGRWWSLLAALAAGAGLATTIYDRLDLEGTVAGIDVGRFLEAGWGLYVAMAGSASLAAAAVGALITSNTLARWATSND
jgi:hypothetical protein